MKLQKPILLATIGAVHGIKGEVRVKSFTDDPLALADYGSLWSLDGRKFKITNLRPQKTVLVVKFKGINSRDEAEALNGTELFVERTALPDDIADDEFYVTDLIDCAVVDTDGAAVGRVIAVPDFGAGSVLEITPSKQTQSSQTHTWYLDFSQKNVPDIDLEKRQITVILPTEISERN